MPRVITGTDINKYIRSLNKKKSKLNIKERLKRLQEMYDNLDVADMTLGALINLCYEISILEGKND